MTQFELLTPGEVETKYGIGRSHLNKLVKAGRIRPTFDPGKPGMARLYSPAVIEAYLKSRDPRGRKLPGVE